MDKSLIQKTIAINAPRKNVWRVFTDPSVTRRMGGEYVSGWKIGSSFGWKGTDGTMYTEGTILQLEDEQLLQHDLFDREDKTIVTSVITYRFIEANESTVLVAREELSGKMTDKEYEEALAGWDIALRAVKDTAEKL